MTLEARLARVAVSAAAGLWLLLVGLSAMPTCPCPMFGRSPGLLEGPGGTTLLVLSAIVAVAVYLASRSGRVLRVVAWSLAAVALLAAVAVLLPPLGPTVAPDVIAP